MSVPRLGISLRYEEVASAAKLAEDLEMLAEIGADFVEVCPQGLGIIVGGRIDWDRLEPVKEALASSDLEYTVHPPLRLNLMDLERLELQRNILESGVLFAGEISASAVVCHAGVRYNRQHAHHNLLAQMSAERDALREVGDLAGELGVTIAVENWCPIQSLIGGDHYTYSVWPSELAGQVAAVDHPAVGVCLDIGHAFVASTFHGFDFLRECATAAPTVSHLHLHDNLGRPEPVREPEPTERLAYGVGDLHLPPGKGDIPLDELFSEIEFPKNPAACVELPAQTSSTVAQEALKDARVLIGLNHERVVG